MDHLPPAELAALPLTVVFAAMHRYCDSAKQSGQRDRWLQWLEADELP